MAINILDDGWMGGGMDGWICSYLQLLNDTLLKEENAFEILELRFSMFMSLYIQDFPVLLANLVIMISSRQKPLTAQVKKTGNILTWLLKG